jgi:transcription antitermination protein NusB
MEQQQHLSRSCIVSSLYANAILPQPDNESLSRLITYIGHNFSGREPQYELVERVVLEVVKKQKLLDDIISRAAPKFKIDQMYIPIIVILRMGIYELVFENTITKPSIIISEAVALAHLYGTQQDAKFVNGVLGTIFAELGLKTKAKEQKQKTQDIVAEHTYKIGVCIYSYDTNKTVHIAMIRDVWGYWTLPKETYINQVDSNLESVATEKMKSTTSLDVDID